MYRIYLYIIFIFLYRSVIGDVSGNINVGMRDVFDTINYDKRVLNNVIVGAFVDTNEILVGDQVNMKLSAKVPARSKIYFPDIKDTIIKGIEVIRKGKIDTIAVDRDGISEYEQRIIISGYDSGVFQIPAFKFRYQGANDSAVYDIETHPFLFKVNIIDVDTTRNIRDIKPPLDVPLTFDEILPYILWGLAILSIFLIAIYIYRRYKQNKPLFVLPKKPPIPPHIKALNSIEELKGKKLWQNNKIKEYYTELTDILRIYIYERYGINAMEMISNEIIDRLSSVEEIDRTLLLKLGDMLMLSDMVKFAKMLPLPDEHENSMRIVVDFVKNTAKEEKEGEEEEKDEK